MKKQPAILLLSGGIDSVIVAAHIRKTYDVIPLFFDYGQLTAKKELFCVNKIAEKLNLKDPIIINLPWLKYISKNSGLIRRSVELTSKNNWVNEYIPFRNTIFLSVAVALAESANINKIFIGSTRTDRVSPDNSPRYLAAMQKVVDLGTQTSNNIKILAPFIKKSKSEIIKIGCGLNVPLESTWSCHKNGKSACGLCGNCNDRINAFRNNGLEDQIKYARKV